MSRDTADMKILIGAVAVLIAVCSSAGITLTVAALLPSVLVAVQR